MKPFEKIGSTIYVMYVTMMDGTVEEMRGYLESGIAEGVVTFAWSDSTVIIPLHNIRMMTQSEEPVE